jgi:hypothetical protein
MKHIPIEEQENGRLILLSEADTEAHVNALLDKYKEVGAGKYHDIEDMIFQYALQEKKSLVHASTFLYALLASLTSYADKELNLKCHIFKDYLSINDPDSSDKFPTKLLDFPPSKGYIYNSMKIRAGFINRLKLVKEELKIAESQMKGKKGKPGV